MIGCLEIKSNLSPTFFLKLREPKEVILYNRRGISVTVTNHKQTDSSKKRWMYVFLSIGIMMCLGTVYSWGVFQMPVEEYYHVSAAKSGMPYMISLAFYALFMMLSGKYLDRYSPRRVLFIGSMLVVLGWMLSSVVPNIYLLTITYGGIMGAGVGIAYGVPMSVVSRWFPEKKGFIVGVVLIGFGLSPLLTAPLASQLVNHYGLNQAFRILGVLFAVLLPLLSWPMRMPARDLMIGILEKENASFPTNEITTKELLGNGNFKRLYICFMLGTMMGLTLIGMTASVGIEFIKIPSDKIALLLSLYAIFNGLGRPTFGHLTDKIGNKRTMQLSYSLIMVAAILMLIAEEGSWMLYVLAFSLFWFNLGGWLAIAPAATLEYYGSDNYSRIYGMVFTAYGIGAIAGVSLSGILRDMSGSYDPIFWSILGICVIGILISQKNIEGKTKKRNGEQR